MVLAKPSLEPAPGKEASAWGGVGVGGLVGRVKSTRMSMCTQRRPQEASLEEGEDEAAATQLELTSSGYF